MTAKQGVIDFTGIAFHNENNRHSEQILVDNEPRLSKNCKTIYDALMRGERLTGAIIVTKYKMLEYRRRIKDLKAAGVEIAEKTLEGGFKEWFILK